MKKITQPTLYCPLPAALNPHARAADRHTIAWARRFRLVTADAAERRFVATGFGHLAARAYPNAPRAELMIISDWLAWLFIKDDQCDEADLSTPLEGLTALHARSLEILEGADPAADDGPLAHALADLRARLQRTASAAWMAHFIRNVADYFAGIVWETANRAAGRQPSVAAYIRMRPFTGAIYCLFDLIEVGERIDLPADVRRHPELRLLKLLANNIASWTNDLFSFEKELRQGNAHNLVLALRAEFGLTLPSAVARAAEMHDAEMRAFVKLGARLPSFGLAADTALKRYAAGLRAALRGHLDWAQASGRYATASVA